MNPYAVVMLLWPIALCGGLALLWFGRKRMTGRLRLFVMLIGGSLVGFLLSVVLHNAISWLAGEILNTPGVEEPLFFILATIVCPLVLLLGIARTLVTWLKGRAAPR